MASPQGDVRVALPPSTPVFERHSITLPILRSPPPPPHPQSQPSTSSSTFTCPYDGCGKAFSRKAKLSEHLNTHTGERPFVCGRGGCGASYRSSSKLRAHERTHLSAHDQEKTKSFACTHCDKKFWTGQHLKRHFDGVHGDGEQTSGVSLAKEYRCDEPGCEATFSKRKKLREHIWASHTDKRSGEGSTSMVLPFLCSHPGCDRRFPTNSKRKTHFKTAHTDEARYTCALEHAGATQALSFPTWSALQIHMREAHPPTCPYATCNGKTFKNKENLKLHIRRHEDKEREAQAEAEAQAQAQYVLSTADDGTSDGYHLSATIDEEEHGNNDEATQPRASSRSFPCEWQSSDTTAVTCAKVFKSLHAMKTHVRVAHLKERPFACGCGKAYGHRHLLKRHEAKCSQAQALAQAERGISDDDEDAVFRRNGGALPDTLRNVEPTQKKRKRAGEHDQRPWDRTGTSMLDLLTGSSYNSAPAPAKRKRQMRGRVVACPWPKLQALLPARGNDRDEEERTACQHAFSRVYDVRRHLRASHHVDLDDAEVRALLDRDEVARLATPRRE